MEPTPVPRTPVSQRIGAAAPAESKEDSAAAAGGAIVLAQQDCVDTWSTDKIEAENLIQVSDVDIVVFPPLTCVPHTRTGQEGPLASPFARESGPPVLWRRLSLMQ